MPPKMMDYETFKMEVKRRGCRIETITKHRSKIYQGEQFVSDFSIAHRKGAKDGVLDVYFKAFLKSLDNMEA